MGIGNRRPESGYRVYGGMVTGWKGERVSGDRKLNAMKLR
ncbi:hypothetical protein EV194_102350 [Natronoflexus pectinivorans]|uniref:Uncharacterized protein n=1 Tax=Natronoflexus pectinivorans TaxID=682526 RepID=A0A4V2RWT4_9BACT|nr:hypothetical protein EV194_102350 [Natronoflexus pectinivorans]